MLELQKFLHSGGALSDLTSELGIKSTRHSAHPNLVLFKYSQIESPRAHPIVMECRGVILDEANEWSIVSMPYRRFFNWGEGHAAPIDWNTARAYDKLDGSIMTLFFYEGEWHVSSSGVPCASSAVSDFGFSFRELFWKTWKDLGYQLPTDKDRCFMFELMTLYNRVVCQYGSPRLVLHGVRNLSNLQEEAPEPWADKYGWECVQFMQWGDIDEVLAAAAALDPMKNEGFVICDANFNRVKVKAAAYVAIHQLRSSVSEKALLEIVRVGETSEFLTYFPEYADAHNKLLTAYTTLCEDIHTTYDRIKHHETQKDFALEATQFPYSGILFSVRAGQMESIKQGLATMPIDKVQDLLRRCDLITKVELVAEASLD